MVMYTLILAQKGQGRRIVIVMCQPGEAILALGSWRQEDQSHSQLHSKFEANLVYNRLKKFT